MKFGLVGLPNVGKSTLFNAILGREVAKASNFPFCTIDPNIAYTEVCDPDLDNLGKLSKSDKTIHPILECVDIAGLVKGASSGVGLGNQFLSHIRQVDLILHVLRCFDDDLITHVENKIDPTVDAEIINFEIILSDLGVLTKIKENRKFMSQFSKKQLEILDLAENTLKQEKMIYNLPNISKEDMKLIRNLGLISARPMMYIANGPADSPYLDLLKNMDSDVIQVDILDQDDLTKLVQKCYEKLDLITFYTTGPKETRGWSISKGTTAINAGGVIHSDFVSRFIMAKVASYSDYIQGNQKMRNEGRDYIVKNKDICHFNLRK